MSTKSVFCIRLFTITIIAAIIFSTSGVHHVQAETTQPVQIQQPVKPLATLDRSINVERFPSTDSIVVHFNTPMNPDSSQNPLLSYPYQDGTWTWETENKTLTFNPRLSLESGGAYVFFIDPSLTSSNGIAFDSSPQWKIQVIPGPQVTGITPAPGNLRSRKPVIHITFDRAMDRAATEKSFSIRPAISYDLKWIDDTKIELLLNNPFPYGQQFNFLFSGGQVENAAKDKDGNLLADDYSWSYGLEPFSAHVLPSGAKSVWIEFSHELDISKTITPFSISPTVNGEWKWQGKKIIMFTAEEEFPLGQIFTLSINGPLYDSEGTVTLVTTSYDFAAPAPISLASPSDNSNSISVGHSPVQLTFKTEVNKKSAEEAFSITPSVSGRIVWSRSNNSSFDDVLSFYPNELFDHETTYTIEVNTSLTAANDNSLLAEPYITTFTTRYAYDYYMGYEESANFGWGTKVQVVDTIGPRRIQFGADESETIIFEAYAYDLLEFASFYSDYASQGQLPTPAGKGKEPVARWRYVEINPEFQETIIPPEVPPGLYVINLRYGGRSFDQLFVAITRNNIVVKQAGDELFVWVSDIHGGNVEDAEIRLYSSRGEKVREGKTDENGLYRVSIPDGDIPLLVAARTGQNNKDVTISGFGSRWEEHANGYWPSRGDSRIHLAYIYTERPIYRPGQIVYFKALIRRDQDMNYSIPEPGLPVTINIRDPRNNLLQTSTMNTNEFGTLHGSFSIAAEGALGNYRVEATINGETTSQTFKVQDYRKPDFRVTVSPKDDTTSNRYVNNDKVRVSVDAEYFFGEPVKDAKLSFKLYRLVPHYYWGRWNATDPQYSWYANAYDPAITATSINADGRAEVEFSARFADDYYFDNYGYWSNSLRYKTYAIEVTADDGSNQPVSSSYIFTVYNSEQKITLDTQGYFKQAHTPFTLTINTKTIDDKPMPHRPLTLTVHSWNSSNFDFTDQFESYEIQTDNDGLVRQDLKLPAGYYKLIISGQDLRNNSISYERWLRVFPSGNAWNVRYRDPISITADSDEYKPYQTARFAIESDISGPALLTFERGSVIHSKEIVLTAPLTLVDTEIIPEDAPNVYVTVNAWKTVPRPTGEQTQWFRGNIADNLLIMAATEIRVSAEAKKLEVDISTDKAVYAPGEEVTVSMNITDSTGNAAQAEVSLAMVDEAIFSLSGELEQNIFDAFYGPRRWAVSTYTSMSPYRVIFDGGGRGGGGGDVGEGPLPRDDFQDTAAWFPEVRTDENGHASLTFTLPDNITSWRLSAKAISISNLVGQSYTNIEARKDLLLRPLLPRILTTGDQAGITTMLHNYSTTDQAVRVTLMAEGMKINGSATQVVSVGAGEVQAVGWSVIPETSANTNVTITATAAGLSDSVKLPLAIQPLAIKDVQTVSGQFNGAITIPLPLPPDLLSDASDVTLKLSRTQSSTVLDGLEYLTGYPYGCVEQTMSRAMPNAVLARASSQLGIGSEAFAVRTKPLVDASIQKLYGLQHQDGGWGWWYDDYSDPYQTAWVLHGLSNIRDAGYTIDTQVLERGSEFLSGRVPDMDIRTRAYALFSMALAGHGNKENTVGLMDESLNQLDPFSQAALALTLHRLEESTRAEKILAHLEQGVSQVGEYTYWPQSTYDGEYRRKTMASTIRTTAMVLTALMQIQGNSDLADSTADYLIQNRTGHGWGTTNETSFTILALTDYLAGKQEFSGASNFIAELNGRDLAEGALQTGNLFTTITIPVEDLSAGLNTLKLTTSGTDPLYYDVITSYITPKESTEPAGPVTITRQYLDPKTNKPLEAIIEGQLVQVKLTMNIPVDSSFMIVEDHLPGGLEALNSGLSSTTQDVIQYESNYFEETFLWRDNGYNYKEIRGDRVSFFITEIQRGSKTLVYFARATSFGTFTALPAEAYAMYDETIWGRSSSTSVEILPR